MVVSQNFYVLNFGFPFFSNYINEITLILLTIVGFFLVFIGANLIDGFNGLLSIHSFIILLIIFFIVEKNFFFNRDAIIFILIALIVFLYFNLIKQNLFLGDSGAYFFGSLIAILIIGT
jgi:UDP-N-acetylmuramyl pentapeptide phosphotransferase/UDP-N-acetylglucosamine-1-phosphate transferase